MQYKHTTNGFKLAYRDLGAGPLVVCLHGFPDTFDTWQQTQDCLAANGFRTIAPALRGYDPSGIPSNRDYSLRSLCDDVVTLLDHLGATQAAIIGHDWGAQIGYAFAALHPDRLTSLVTLAIPPLRASPTGFRERWARPHNLYLNRGAISNWWLRRNDFAEVDRLFGKWSPNWQPRQATIDRAKQAFSDPTYSRAAVDYYAERMTEADAQAILRPIQIPTLMIYGEDEPLVRQEAYQRAISVTGPGSEVHCLNEVGHWPHLEDPQGFQALAMPFIKQYGRITESLHPGSHR